MDIRVTDALTDREIDCLNWTAPARPVPKSQKS